LPQRYNTNIPQLTARTRQTVLWRDCEELDLISGKEKQRIRQTLSWAVQFAKSSAMMPFVLLLLMAAWTLPPVVAFSASRLPHNPLTEVAFLSHVRNAPFHLRLSSSIISNDEDLLPGIAAIDMGNGDLMTRLEKLCDQPYFRLYSVDILASCEYLPQELFECYTESCEIYPEDEENVSRSDCAHDGDHDSMKAANCSLSH
jgi:Endoplasmic Reticulum Oxidoreductin 1 (ERO1)